MWAKHLMNVSQVRRNFYLKLKKKSCAQLKERESWFTDKKIDSEKQREPSLIKNLTQVKLASSWFVLREDRLTSISERLRFGCLIFLLAQQKWKHGKLTDDIKYIKQHCSPRDCYICFGTYSGGKCKRANILNIERKRENISIKGIK